MAFRIARANTSGMSASAARKEQPDDDAGQDDDDEGATPGPTAGLPASVAPPGCDVRPGPQRRFQHQALTSSSTF